MTAKQKNNIPKLRFPEFKDEWEETTLGKISKNVMYGMNAAATIFDGYNKYIRITDIDEVSKNFVPNPLTSPKGALEDKYKLKTGDIVFARTGASVGKSYLYKEQDGNLYFAGFLIRFSIIKNNPFFVYTLTLKNSYSKWIKLMSMRSGQPGINAEEYKALRLSIPALPEQQKIASCLTAIDDKIQQLTKKKELLEKYKKGVMQKIFSQKIRFKDDKGKEYTEWKERSLSDFLISSPREVEKPKGNYLAIGIRSHCKGTFQKPDSDPNKIEMDKLYVVKENDLIVNITFAWEGAIALAKEEDDGGLVSHRFPNYVFNRNIMLHEYFQYVFIQKRFRMMLDLISPGGAGRNRVMNKTDFLKIQCKVPCIEEQRKIASFLAEIDKKIEHAGKQFEMIKAFKKGLLQQMFV